MATRPTRDGPHTPADIERPKLQPLTADDISRLRRKDLWTLHETACALMGYCHDPQVAQSDIPHEVIEATNDMGRARAAGNLLPCGPSDEHGRRYLFRQDDVIRWAADRFPKFPFVGRTAATSPEPPALQTRAQQQDESVLAAIRKAGYDPTALPAAKPGRAGVKAEIRASLPAMKPSQFKHAWERLRDGGEIATKT
jgi:hypothetical protein